MNNPQSYNQDILRDVSIESSCRDYLKTLEWNWYYYNGTLISNTTFYEHAHGPLFGDLMKYIPICNGEVIHKNTENAEINILPLTQLYFVLPIEDHDKIIPKAQYESTQESIYHNYPLLKNNNFDVDYSLCKYFWESHMLLDSFDCHELNSFIMNINS